MNVNLFVGWNGVLILPCWHWANYLWPSVILNWQTLHCCGVTFGRNSSQWLCKSTFSHPADDLLEVTHLAGTLLYHYLLHKPVIKKYYSSNIIAITCDSGYYYYYFYHIYPQWSVASTGSSDGSRKDWTHVSVTVAPSCEELLRFSSFPISGWPVWEPTLIMI